MQAKTEVRIITGGIISVNLFSLAMSMLIKSALSLSAEAQDEIH